jgi:hypothetical protein
MMLRLLQQAPSAAVIDAISAIAWLSVDAGA